MKKYDIAAIIWPAYTGDEIRSRIFWPEGYGEWQTVKAMTARAEGHLWPRKPLWGYVNEADPYVMEAEINAATDHGVNVFIYDWYWYDGKPFLNQCLNNGFLKAQNNDKMKFYIMWANHTADSLWDKRTSELFAPIWDGAVDRTNFEKIVNLTVSEYFSHPSYYKINGKPVYMIYDVENLVRGLGGVEETLSALDYFREQTVKAGFPGLELHLTLRNRPYLNNVLDAKTGTNILSFINRAEFDGVTHYQYCHFTYMGRKYTEILKDVENEWQYIKENIKVPYYPNISVGWDSNPRFNKYNKDVCVENTPENVRLGFEMAKKYIDTSTDLSAPLITVNSWNEWTEGSYIEPDDLYGYGYLKVIKDVFTSNN